MITSKEEFKAYCEADKLANSKQLDSFKLKIKQLLFPDLTWIFLARLRKTEYVKNCKKGLIGKIEYAYQYYRFRKISLKLGFTIPLNVFGPGLSIPHYGTIVVNSAAKVGKNCRLHVSANIGASGGSATAPTIGDNVYIGPGAIIFGDIQINDNVTIAANATVNKSVAVKNVTVGGTPAEIIKENTSVWWENNRLSL